MNATLTITIRVLGAQAAQQVKQVQQQVQQVQQQANRGSGSGGGGWLATLAGAANTARSAVMGLGDGLMTVGRTFGNWANNLSRVGRQMTFGFTLPVAFAGKQVMDWALDNERAMTMVRKVYGDGTESAGQLNAELKALETTFRLLSDRYGENQADVIRIGSAWAAAGLKADALAKATETTLQVMTLGEMDADKTVSSIMAIAAAYHLSFRDMGNGMSEVSDAMSIFNAVENQTGATFADLIDGAERSAAAARAAGVDIKDLAAMIAALTPTTGSGAAAGNAIKTIISRIMAPTKQTQEILKQIGIDISGKEWNNSTALQKIQTMSNKFQDLDQATKNWVSTTVAGRWQLNRFEQLMSDLSTSNSMYAKAQEASSSVTKRQTTYWKELGEVLASNPKKFEILTNALKNELTDVGVDLIPVLLGIVNGLRQIAVWFNNLSPTTKSWIITLVMLTAAAGPVLFLLSTLFRVLEFGFVVMGGVFKGTIWLAGGMARLAPKIIDAATAFGSFLASMVRAAWYMGTALAKVIWESIVAFARLAWSAVVAAGKIAVEFVVSIAKAAWSITVQLGAAIAQGIISFVMFAASAVASAAATVIAWVVQAVPVIVSSLAAMTAAIAGFAATLGLPLWALVAIVAAVAAAIALIIWAFANEDIREPIVEALKMVAKSMWFLPNVFVQVFSALIRIVGKAIGIIRDLLSYLNPFARHSPSLVDNVKAGVAVILSEYAKLRQIPTYIARAAAAHQAFVNATAGATSAFDRADVAEQRSTVAKVAPQALPSFDNMQVAKSNLAAQLPGLTQVIAVQQRLVDGLQDKYDALDNTLVQHQRILEDLEYQYDAVSSAIDAAKDRIDDLLNTPLTGLTKMEEEIYQNELAQKRLTLAIMDLEDAGQSVDDLQSRFAALGGELESLQGERNSMYLGGAGSDILGVYDEQIDMLKKQRKELTGQSSTLSEMQKQLEKLKRTGERLGLQKALTFDDQVRQLEKMSKVVEEMSFDEIAKQIAAQKKIIEDLQPLYDDLGAKVEVEKKHVKDIQRLRDLVGRQLDDEKKKLDALNEAYDSIVDLLQQMNSEIETFVGRVEKALKAMEEMSGITPGDYEIPGGEGGLFDEEGTLADLEDFNKKLQEELEKALKDMPDPFAGFKGFVEGLRNNLSMARLALQIWWDQFKAKLFDIGFGIAMKLGEITQFFVNLPDNLMNALTTISAFVGVFMEKGKELIGGFLLGLWLKWNEVVAWFLGLPRSILLAVATAGGWLVSTGSAAINGFLFGLAVAWNGVVSWFQGMPGTIQNLLSRAGSWLVQTGSSVIGGLLWGIVSAWNGVASWLSGLGLRVIQAVGNAGSWLVQKGADIITGLWNGISFMGGWLMARMTQIPGWVINAIPNAGNWLGQTGKNIAIGLWNGINSMSNWFRDQIIKWAKFIIPDPLERFFGIASPSKLMAKYGNYIVEGLANGILDSKDMTVRAAQTVAESVQDALTISPTMSATLDINSTIGSLPNFDIKSMTQDLTMGMAQAAVSVSNTALTQAVQQTMAQPAWNDQGGYPADPGAQSAPVSVTVDGGGGDTIQVSVANLVLPNISSPDDARTLLDNLKALADD